MTMRDILERTTSVLSSERVYSEPQIVNGVTIIPAAAVRGGGGGGESQEPGEVGQGAGYGMSAVPAGALVIDGDKVRWKVPFYLNRVILGGQLVGISFFVFSWLTARSKARAAVKIARINARAIRAAGRDEIP